MKTDDEGQDDAVNSLMHVACLVIETHGHHVHAYTQFRAQARALLPRDAWSDELFAEVWRTVGGELTG